MHHHKCLRHDTVDGKVIKLLSAVLPFGSAVEGAMGVTVIDELGHSTSRKGLCCSIHTNETYIDKDVNVMGIVLLTTNFYRSGRITNAVSGNNGCTLSE